MSIDGKHRVEAIPVTGFLLANKKGEMKTADGVFASKIDGQWYVARGIYSGKGTPVESIYPKFQWCKEAWEKAQFFTKNPITWTKGELLESSNGS